MILEAGFLRILKSCLDLFLEKLESPRGSRLGAGEGREAGAGGRRAGRDSAGRMVGPRRPEVASLLGAGVVPKILFYALKDKPENTV